MQIRCPHCQNGIELVDESELQSVDCPSCGSQFGLVDVDQESIDTFDSAHGGNATIGHFELVTEVGRGAFGSVWQAHDSKLDRKVAIKVPRPGQFTQSSREQFLREARAAAQLNHPNIVSVYEVGLDVDRIYIVSDFVDGISLADLLSADRLSPRQAIRLCAKVALALEHAHKNGVIHRDLKPANIMLDQNNEPFVMDFGLAKRDAGEITMTLDGKLLGTPAYMPPEQARGEGHHVDRRADVYSVGVILYELLTGELPFRGTTRMLLHQVMHEEAPSPRKLNNSIPRDLETITLKCLEKEPDKRYGTCAALGEDLQAWLDHKPIKARPTTWMERSWRWCKRKPAVAALSAGMLLVLLGATVISTVFAVAATREAREADVQRGVAESRAIEVGLALASADEERKKAEGQREIAEAQRGLFESQKMIAENALWGAEQQRKIAEEEKATALRLAYASDMRLIQRDWDNNDIRGFMSLLTRYRGNGELPGFEWYYWNRQSHMYELSLRSRNSSLTNIAFHPDGQRIVSIGNISPAGSSVQIWDVADGNILVTMAEDPGFGVCVAFSPDGAQVITGNQDGTIKTWDADTGAEILSFMGHKGQVSCITYSTDGTRIASGGFDETVRIWDSQSGKQIRSFHGQKPELLKNLSADIHSVAFSPNGKLVAASGKDMLIRVWDIEDSKESLIIDGHQTIINRVAFGPDGKQLASGGLDSSIKIWDAQTGTEIQSLDRHTQAVTDIVYSSDGKRLASCGFDATIRMWDVENGQELSVIKGHTSAIRSIALGPEGNRIASSSLDQTIKIWEIASCNELSEIAVPDGNVSSVVFSPNGTWICSGGWYGKIEVWDANHYGQLFELEGHTGYVSDISFRFDGKRIASSSHDGTIKVWNCETAENLLTLEGHADQVHSVTFTPRGKRLVSCSEDRTVRIWNAMSGELLRILRGHEEAVREVAINSTGTRIASASEDGSIIIWDAMTGEIVFTLTGDGSTSVTVTFGKDDTRVLTAGAAGRITVWDATSGQRISTLKGHGQGVLDVTYDPDSRRIASSSYDGTIKIWDAEDGHELLTLVSPDGSPQTVAFSPDGQRIVSAARRVLIWDARPIKVDVQPAAN